MTGQDGSSSAERAGLATMLELASANERNWDARMQHVLLVEARVLGVERVSFWELCEESERHRVLSREMGYDRTVATFARGPSLPVSERSDYLDSLVKDAPLSVERGRDDPRYRAARDYLDGRHIVSLLDCPVWCGGELGGVLSVEQVGAARRWTASEGAFAVAAAVTASAALEVRARKRAQADSRRMAFLERAARTLGRTLDADEVCRRAVALAVPALADGARIGIFEGGSMRIMAVEHRSAEGRALLEGALRDTGADQRGGRIARIVAKFGTPILVPDVTQHAFVEAVEQSYPKMLGVYRALGIQSLLWVPLYAGDSLVGTLALHATRRFGADDLDRAEELAHHVSNALANAQLHRRVEAALQVREEFIMLAGHELRTPLTALQLSTEDLVRRAPDERTGRSARNILQQVKRLDRLSSQMLDAARVASGMQFPCSPAPTDLAAVARETGEALRALLASRGCTLVLRADEPVVGVWDATQLDEMLACLLDNAAKFGAGNPVEIAVGHDDGGATLSVADHGQGIPPDRLANIFEKFERAAPATRYGGLGLGLFIAKAIAEAHGGGLSVENRPGDGVTFTAHLPLQPAKAASP